MSENIRFFEIVEALKKTKGYSLTRFNSQVY